MLVNWNTGPHNLVHSDERRDRPGSSVTQPRTDMTGQYAASSGASNEPVQLKR